MSLEEQSPLIEQPKQAKAPRFVSGAEWLVLLILAFATNIAAMRYGSAAFVESSIGRLVAFALIWIAIRGIYRWIAKK